MKLYILEYWSFCHDCGAGSISGAFSSIDKLYEEARNIAEDRGDDIEKYGIDHYVKIHETILDKN